MTMANPWFMSDLASLGSVVLPIPPHEPPPPHLDGRRRREADRVGERLHVGEGGGDVAGLHGEQVLLGLLAQRFLDQLDQPHQLDRRGVADVVDAAGGAAGGGGGGGGGPGGGGRCGGGG